MAAAAAVREHPLPKFLKRKANFIQHFFLLFSLYCTPIKLGARSVAVVVVVGGVVEMERSSSGSCRLNLILIRLEKHAVDTLLSLSCYIFSFFPLLLSALFPIFCPLWQ